LSSGQHAGLQRRTAGLATQTEVQAPGLKYQRPVSLIRCPGDRSEPCRSTDRDRHSISINRSVMIWKS
jgi:hypothetical protein